MWLIHIYQTKLDQCVGQRRIGTEAQLDCGERQEELAVRRLKDLDILGLGSDKAPCTSLPGSIWGGRGEQDEVILCRPQGTSDGCR